MNANGCKLMTQKTNWKKGQRQNENENWGFLFALQNTKLCMGMHDDVELSWVAF